MDLCRILDMRGALADQAVEGMVVVAVEEGSRKFIPLVSSCVGMKRRRANVLTTGRLLWSIRIRDGDQRRRMYAQTKRRLA